MFTRARSKATSPRMNRSATRTATASTMRGCPTIRSRSRKIRSAPTRTKQRGRRLPEAVHDLFQRLRPRPDAIERQRRQRFVDDVQLRQEVVAIRLDVNDAGGELAAPRGLVQPFQRTDLV